MKKIVLGASLIIAFVIYILFEQKSSGVLVATLPTPTTAPVSTKTSGMYKNGDYTGTVVDAYYGNIQVKATVKNGALADVVFLQYPNDQRTSVEINQQAIPILKSEAIQAQNAQVDIVSGATDSSKAFKESLGKALAMAKL